MTAATKAREARRATEDSDVVQRLGRFGLASRGAVWITLAVLAARLAVGDHREQAGPRGALRLLGGSAPGRVLLGVAAVGFAGFALWRAVEAVFDPRDTGTRQRVLAGLHAAAYVALAAAVARHALSGPPANGSQPERTLTARLMSQPAGRWLVALAGVAVLTAGAVMLWRGVRRRFREPLKEGELDGVSGPLVDVLAVAGHVGRAVVLALVGAFLVRSAVTHRADDTIGLDGSLQEVAEAPYGPPLLLVVAVALAAYGAYSMLEARYRAVLRS